MKSWKGKHLKVAAFELNCINKLELGSADNITPVILTTMQAKFLRDCLIKVYNPRKTSTILISRVSMTCLGFKHRGDILWMTNLADLMYDIGKVKAKLPNDAAQMMQWGYKTHYQEIIDRIEVKTTTKYKDFNQPNKVIDCNGLCTYIVPPKKDTK